MTATAPATIDPDFMTLYELADRLGVSYSTVFDRLQRRDLPVPAVKIGRRWMVPREAYDAWKASLWKSGAA